MTSDTPQNTEISSSEAPTPSFFTQLDEKDRLIILKPGFADAAYPGETFYCWHCVLMEGLLTSFPEMDEQLDVHRIAWPKPRTEIVEIIGEENQSLPVLILAENTQLAMPTKNYEGVRFIDDKDSILKAMSLIYSIPVPHP